ncbi:hypothetical protein VNO77_22728 [Canavalia gladiata]|uniref:Uncharacterized protein n=1 Tax=Canavalia gladiata TaxID=3824 RepID=A0AAN9L350_CANGL
MIEPLGVSKGSCSLKGSLVLMWKRPSASVWMFPFERLVRKVLTGCDLILSISYHIESPDRIIKALGWRSLAFLHEAGSTPKDCERFITSIPIFNFDQKRPRVQFYEELIGMTACEGSHFLGFENENFLGFLMMVQQLLEDFPGHISGSDHPRHITSSKLPQSESLSTLLILA